MKQHILPVLSLNHFAGEDGHVWTYDKLNGRRWHAIPKETGCETHYYSVEREDGTMDITLEQLLSEIESDAAPAYERMASGELPSGGDRELFGFFLGAMYVRTPKMRRFAAETHKWMLETHIAANVAHPGAFKTLLKRYEADGVDVSDPEFIRRSLMDMSHSNLHLPKAYVLRILEQAPKIAEVFLNMKWSLLRAEDHFFVTCDNPIFRSVDPKTCHPLLGDHGLVNKTAEITFPLSPKRILLMHWEWQANREYVLPREWVRNENGKRAANADRQVYAHLEHKKIARLVAQYVGKPKRPMVRSSGFAGSIGFHDVVVPRRWDREPKGKSPAR